jgi:dihydrolipoamide dehydrogenase
VLDPVRHEDDAGEWLQQGTLAIRARVPLDVLLDTIQPFSTFSTFSTFSELYLDPLTGATYDIDGGQQLVEQ